MLGDCLFSAARYIYSAFVVVDALSDVATRRDVSVDGAKQLQIAVVQLTDVFLLGTVPAIVASGLYQIFLGPKLPAPDWLRSDDLDQLTIKVMEVVGLLLVSHRVRGDVESPRVPLRGRPRSGPGGNPPGAPRRSD